MPNLISIREYARRRNCSDTAVHKAIRTQKIVKGVVRDEKDRPKIDPEIADKEWSVYFDHEATQNKELAKKIPKPSTASDAPAVEGGGTQGSYAKARLALTMAKAQTAALDFKVKSGKLVDKGAVYSSLFTAGQEVRAAMQAIPDRHIDEILAAPSRNEAHTILYNVIADALEKLSELGKRELTPRAA